MSSEILWNWFWYFSTCWYFRLQLLPLIFSNFISGQELRISVFDEDTFSANDPLGSRSLPILDLIETNAGQRPLAGNDTFNIYWEYMGISRDIFFLYSLL